MSYSSVEYVYTHWLFSKITSVELLDIWNRIQLLFENVKSMQPHIFRAVIFRGLYTVYSTYYIDYDSTVLGTTIG